MTKHLFPAKQSESLRQLPPNRQIFRIASNVVGMAVKETEENLEGFLLLQVGLGSIVDVAKVGT